MTYWLDSLGFGAKIAFRTPKKYNSVQKGVTQNVLGWWNWSCWNWSCWNWVPFRNWTGGSPNRVEDLSFDDKSWVQDLRKSRTLGKLGGKSSTQRGFKGWVGDLRKSSPEDLWALPREQINPQFGIFVNPELRIYHRKINPQLYWESLQEPIR